MPFGINVKEVKAEVIAKFDVLISKLDEILTAIKELKTK